MKYAFFALVAFALAGCATVSGQFVPGPGFSACAAGDGEACWAYATERERGNETSRRDAFVAFQFGCHLDHAASCRKLAGFMGRSSTEDPRRVIESLEKACAGDDMVACVDLAKRLPDFRSKPLYDKACRAGIGEGCLGLARSFKARWRIESSLREALALDLKACELGTVAGCVGAGQSLVFGSGVEVDTKRGLELLERGCNEEHGEGCLILAKIFEDGLGVEADMPRASAYYDFAESHRSDPAARTPAKAFVVYVDGCNRGNSLGCFNAAEMLREGIDVARNVSTARDLYTHACQDGVSLGCSRADSLIVRERLP